MSLQSFVSAYIECALWSSTDDDGVPLDSNYGPEDLAPEALAQMEADCISFCAALCLFRWDAVMSDVQAGHDFWLTRNGHGAGFWDRGLGSTGDALTTHAESYGSADLYIGDDGKIYHD